jgi:hypothetical protein
MRCRFLLGLLFTGVRVFAADAPLVFVQNSPGRFEVAAADATLAHGVASATEELWRVLAVPLALPELFSSPIFVRIVQGANETTGESAAFRVTVEIGGIVSIRLRADAAGTPAMRHALVQGLLMRIAVAHHGAEPRVTSPLWLEHACLEWWRTRTNAAQFDAVKQETARLAVPRLESLLLWRHGSGAPRESIVGSLWLMSFLLVESGPGREWPAYLVRVLGGDDPLVALATSYPERFNGAEERELWWQTGWHHARRIRSLPALEAAESRVQLAALSRFVFAGATDDADAVVPLRTVMARASELVVAAEITRRSAELARLIPTLHPFYRNAGLALGEVFAARAAAAKRLDVVCAAFEQDWRDATELESATSAALDRLEAHGKLP